jgi:uncharacterized protein YabE (DUF348 family)
MRSVRRWRNPWARLKPRPLVQVLLVVAVIAALRIGLWAWQATATPLTVVINGQPIALRVHRNTVGGAIRAAGVRPDEAVYIEPPPETPLQPDMVITVGYLRPVIVHADGQTRIITTHSADPHTIAAEMGIVLGPHDEIRIERAVQPAGSRPDVPPVPRELRVMRSRMVIVNEDGNRVSLETTQPTLGEALAAAGYVLYEGDRISPPLWTPITTDNLEATLERATPVIVQADGNRLEARTHQTTVGGVLSELGLALNGQDYVLPAPDAALQAGQVIRLVRVREEVVSEEAPIPYPTTYIPDPDLELDQQQEVQPGHEGTLRRQVRIRYEDGAEVSRVPAGEWVVAQPEARVIRYGTRIVIRTLETPYGDIQYWRRLHVLATSYCPLTASDKQPGDPFYGLSATGVEVHRGVVAVDPRAINMFTFMYVPEYGFGQALDIGGAVKGLRIDLGYDDANYVQWYKWVDIYLLLPIPPPDEMIWILPGSEP